MNDFSQQVISILQKIDHEIPVPLKAQESALLLALEHDYEIVRQVCVMLSSSFGTTKTTFVFDNFDSPPTAQSFETRFPRLDKSRRERICAFLKKKGWDAYVTRSGYLSVTGTAVNLDSIVEEHITDTFKPA